MLVTMPYLSPRGTLPDFDRSGPPSLTEPFLVAHRGEFPEPNQPVSTRPVLAAKIFPFAIPPNHPHNSRTSSLYEGRIAIVTDVGMGCGGRGSVGRARDCRAGFGP